MNRLPINGYSGVSASPQRQQGVSLLMVLILLVVMSILGVAVLRSSAMQERMSANLGDRNDALQAAEAGLRVAQQTVVGGIFDPMWNGSQTFTDLRSNNGSTCAGNGICDRSLSGDTEKGVVPSSPTSWSYVSGTSGPRYGYVVEYLGVGKGESKDVQQVCNTTSAPAYLCRRPMFRITSYGRGRGLAQVVLQANIISQPQ